MKIIAAYALLTGATIGFMPSEEAARSLDESAIGVDLKMGNGRPDPVDAVDVTLSMLSM